MCQASKGLKMLEEAIDEINDSFSKMKDKTAEYDRLIAQKYHELEIRPAFNAAEGYFIAKELQEILRKRRVVKCELIRLNSIMSSMNLKQIKDATKRTKKNVDKLKSNNKIYMSDFPKDVFEVLH